MKKLFVFFVLVALTKLLFAQAPDQLNYQAVIRDISGNPVLNQNVGIQITIFSGSATGTVEYVETHTSSTNAYGIINLIIGTGNPTTGSFSSISWGNNSYFIKIEADPTGGTSYLDMGTTQLLSVPYALHAKTAENITGTLTETDPVFGLSPAGTISNTDITNWNNKLDTEVDGSITNELQALSISNDTIYLSNGGFVKLPAGFSGNYNDLTNQPTIPTVPTNVSAFTNDAGYLTTFTEIDGSVSNEIQALSISNDTIYLSNGGFVKLPAGFSGDYNDLTNQPTIPTVPTNVSAFTNDAGYLTTFTEVDGSVINEIQALSISNDTIYLSNGGFVKLPAGFNGQYSSLIGAPTNVSAFTNDAGYLTTFTEVDGSVTNEIQALSISNDTIYLTNGGFVKIPLTAWSLIGNSGTVDGTNFLGTTDNAPLNLKVNNQKAGRIESAVQSSTFFGYETGTTNSNIGSSGFGYHALYLNTTGIGNTAVGNLSLAANTTGPSNTAIGASTLQLSNGGWNLATGSQALQMNTTGSWNSANGTQSLMSNTTGNWNSANGTASLYSNTTGNYNTASGGNALWNNKAGNNATAVGYNAMFYSNNTSTTFTNYNVAVGYEALRGSTNPASNTGNSNTAVGYQAIMNNTSGYWNTAIGDLALAANTTGYNNAAMGRRSLNAKTTGYNNTGAGAGSLESNTTGNNNTAVGAGAMLVNVAGNNNTGIGTSIMYNNTSGSNNTIMGFEAGFTNNGSGNIFLGYQAGYSETGSNKLYIANSNVNPPLIYGDFSSGNVGLGTTSPTAKLQVETYGLNNKTIWGMNSLLIQNQTAGSRTLLALAPNGTQNADFVIFHNSDYTTNYECLSLGYENTLNNFIIGTSKAGTGTARRLIIDATGSSSNLWKQLTLASNGDVGIGTTSPTALLHVKGGAIGQPGKIKIEDVDATGLSSLELTNNTGNTFYFYKLSSGYPANGRYTQGVSMIESNNTNGLTLSEVTGDIHFYTGGNNERITIKNNGNVGIGTSTPSDKLEVNGNLKVTGNIYSPGMVVQTIVKTSDLTSSLNTTTFTEANSDYRISITPKYVNSIILVEYYFSINTAMASNTVFQMQLIRDIGGTESFVGTGPVNGIRNQTSWVGRPGNGYNTDDLNTVYMVGKDQGLNAGTTYTYGFKYRREGGGSGTCFFNFNNVNSSDYGFSGIMTMKVTEIAQ